MSTCKDCLYGDNCSICEVIGDDYCCAGFKDKSKFIELPCKVGDYIEWKNNRGNVVLLEVTGFEFDKQGNAQRYLTKYSDIQPFVDSDDVISVIGKEEAQKVLAERRIKI